jgi:ATP adenylyltransferase
MNTLWTPWRMEHVNSTAPRPPGCLFEPPGTASASAEHLLLYRDRTVVVLLNRFPYANGHLLVAPVRHVGELTELTPEENQALMAMLQYAWRILRTHLRPDGCNIGLNLGSEAGAGIGDHLHFHVVPRWAGDHNFMTVLAEVRTIPQHLAETFNQLLPDFQRLLSTGGSHG